MYGIFFNSDNIKKEKVVFLFDYFFYNVYCYISLDSQQMFNPDFFNSALRLYFNYLWWNYYSKINISISIRQPNKYQRRANFLIQRQITDVELSFKIFHYINWKPQNMHSIGCKLLVYQIFSILGDTDPTWIFWKVCRHWLYFVQNL